jgi:hypothetical protein
LLSDSLISNGKNIRLHLFLLNYFHMLTGKIVNLEHAPGMGAIQPDDGGDLMPFSIAELRDPVSADTPVSFDTASKLQGSGAEAINIRVVKASS